MRLHPDYELDLIELYRAQTDALHNLRMALVIEQIDRSSTVEEIMAILEKCKDKANDNKSQ